MLWHDDDGSLAPGLILVVAGLLATGLALSLVGSASVLREEALTAADAAALAAADDLRRQVSAALEDSAAEEPIVLDHRRARAAAEDYAARNGGRVVAFAVKGLDVTVTTATRSAVGSFEAPRFLGGDRADIDAEDVRGRARSRGRVDVDPLGSWPGAPTLTPVQAADAPAWSALRTYDGDGDGPEPSVAGLRPELRREILLVEAATGTPLALTSAYHSPAGQERVCRQERARNPAALCAPPGRSQHQAGLAIDVEDPDVVLAALRADPSIALCQPFPRRDPVHFAHASSPECTGRAFATYDVRLVPATAR
jgi:hypothetical protein